MEGEPSNKNDRGIIRESINGFFNTLPIGIEILRAIKKEKRVSDFEYIAANKMARRIRGGHDRTGKKLLDLEPDNKSFFESLRNVAETGVTWESEFFRQLNLSGLWLRLRVSRIRRYIICSWEDISDQKRAAVVIHNFTDIADATHDAICSLNPEHRISYWNPAAAALYGYSSEEAIGQKMEDLIGSKKNRDLSEALAKVYEHGERIQHLVTSKQQKHGRNIDIMLNIFPFNDETGRIVGACLIAKDITETSRNRNKIREDEHFINQIVETTPDIIYIMDLNTFQVIYTNRQIGSDLGYTRQHIAAMKNTILDIMHPDDIEPMKEHLRRIIAQPGNAVIEIQYRLRDAQGKYNWYCDRNTVFKRNAAGHPVEKIGICQNITKRKLEEEQARTRKQIINQAELVVDIGSWEYDLLDTSFYWSEGMYRLFNIDKQTEVTPEVFLACTPATEKKQVKRLIKNIRSAVPFEETITITREKQQKIIKLKCIVQKDKKDNPLKVIGTGLDLTNQILATEEKNRLYAIVLDKKAELELLTGEIKTFNDFYARYYADTLHQLYTQLEYIVTNEAKNFSDSSKANIRRAQASIQTMNMVTSDVNTYFNLFESELAIRKIEAGTVVQDAISHLQKKLDRYNVLINCNELPTLYADSALFFRLIVYMLENIIHLKKNDTRLKLIIGASQTDDEYYSPYTFKNQDTSYLKLSFSENEGNLDSDEIVKMLDPSLYLSLVGKSKLAWIGFAICKKIMFLHRGFVLPEHDKASGWSFDFYFPILNEPAQTN